MVELPAGSLAGLVAIVLIVGIVIGRSARTMRRIGDLHARAHARSAAAAQAKVDQRVQTVVVVDRDGQRVDDARYDVESIRRVGTAGLFEADGATRRGELGEADPVGDGWPAEGLPVEHEVHRVR